MNQTLSIIIIIVILLGAGLYYIHHQSPKPSGLATGSYSQNSVVLDSHYCSHPPSIDGKIEFREWYAAEKLSFEGGFMAVQNDDIRLYILIDVLDDVTEDEHLTQSAGDYFWLTFDVDGDGDITETDINFQLVPGTGTLRYVHYSAPGSMSPPTTAPIRSTVASGFDCFVADQSEILYVPPLAPSCRKHTLWEVGIDLREIGVTIFDIDPLVDRVNMGLRVVSENPSIDVWHPVDFDYSFDNLIHIQLEPPDYSVYANPDVTYEFDESPFAIELTQAIQDRSNSLRLVAHKDTAARVYPLKEDTETNEPVYLYLYGRRSGAELPGSPLCKMFYPKETIDRNRLYDTANFSIPDSWLTETVEFQAVLYDFFDISVASTPVVKSFLEQKIPTYWFIPIRMVYEGIDYVGDVSRIDNSLNYLKSVYPVHDANIVIKDAEELPIIEPDHHPVDEWGYGVNDALDLLRDYYNNLEHTYALGLYSAGTDSPDFPDQVIGYVYTGGSSDVVCKGGTGHVIAASGYENTIVAHEINHNMDRRPRPEYTWGNHVCNPDDYNDYTWGCGADGCDTDWAAQWTNAALQEIGFDTRRPWRDGFENFHTLSRFTVQPGIYHEFTNDMGTTQWWGCVDFMTYCDSLIKCFYDEDPGTACSSQDVIQILPHRWISPYRWEILFDAFSQPLQVIVQPAWHISGIITSSGAGEFGYAFQEPGLFHTSQSQPSSDYMIEALDKYGNTVASYPLTISMTLSDMKGGEPIQLQSQSFRLTLPDIQGVQSLILTHKGNEIDRLERSEASPTVTVVSPQGGETWESSGYVAWSAFDQDGDELRYTVVYSPDNGKKWHPLAWSIAETSLTVDPSKIPGSESAKIRVIVSDGMNTTYAESYVPFTVKEKGPKAYILAPDDGTSYQAGEDLLFIASGYDLEESILPDRYMHWSFDGTVFGCGRKIHTRLPEGVSTIKLTVYDSRGNYSTTSISLTDESSPTVSTQ